MITSTPTCHDRPLDPAGDPDRNDPALDPDRPAPQPRQPLILGRTGGTRQTLPELLAEGSFHDKPPTCS